MSNSNDYIKFYVPPEEDVLHIPVDNPGDGIIVIHPRDPVLPKDNGDSGDLNFRSFHYYGIVTDEDSGQSIPGASIILFKNGYQVGGQAADNNGTFNIYSEEEADTIKVSAVDYFTKQFGATLIRHDFPIKKDVQGMEEVIVTSGGKKNNWIWLAVAAAVVYDQSQQNGSKRKVSGIDTPTVLAVGAGVAMLIGFKTFTKFLEGLGLFKSPEAKGYEEELKNPYSFWNPLFWQKGPVGTQLVKDQNCIWLWNEIVNSWGTFGDDEDRIYAAFHSIIQYQSQLSFFSYWVQEKKGKNLLSYLIGGNVGPFGDHLSAKEIDKITQYVSRLPKYN